MERFNSKMKSFKYEQHYGADRETVFPLLCFNREYEWIPGWECRMIHSESGYMEKGCIFVSFLKNMPHWTNLDKTLEMNWYVNIHDKEKYYIESTNYVNDLFILKFSIQLIDEKNGKTTAVFAHNYYGLNEKGNEFIENAITEESYIFQQKFLEKVMNYFLNTGKLLKLE